MVLSCVPRLLLPCTTIHADSRPNHATTTASCVLPLFQAGTVENAAAVTIKVIIAKRRRQLEIPCRARKVVHVVGSCITDMSTTKKLRQADVSVWDDA